MDRISAAQCRMARAGLGLGIRELAALADVSTNTVIRLEGGEQLKPATQRIVRAALEGRGVVFVEEAGHAGVLLPIAEPPPP